MKPMGLSPPQNGIGEQSNARRCLFLLSWVILQREREILMLNRIKMEAVCVSWRKKRKVGRGWRGGKERGQEREREQGGGEPKELYDFLTNTRETILVMRERRERESNPCNTNGDYNRLQYQEGYTWTRYSTPHLSDCFLPETGQ